MLPLSLLTMGGDEQVLELMTQTQVQGAAGWLLKGSTVCAVATAPALPSLPGREPGLLTVSSLSVEPSSVLCLEGANLPAFVEPASLQSEELPGWLGAQGRPCRQLLPVALLLWNYLQGPAW